jgi:hypothetical protein
MPSEILRPSAWAPPTTVTVNAFREPARLTIEELERAIAPLRQEPIAWLGSPDILPRLVAEMGATSCTIDRPQRLPFEALEIRSAGPLGGRVGYLYLARWMPPGTLLEIRDREMITVLERAWQTASAAHERDYWQNRLLATLYDEIDRRGGTHGE